MLKPIIGGYGMSKLEKTFMGGFKTMKLVKLLPQKFSAIRYYQSHLPQLADDQPHVHPPGLP